MLSDRLSGHLSDGEAHRRLINVLDELQLLVYTQEGDIKPETLQKIIDKYKADKV